MYLPRLINNFCSIFNFLFYVAFCLSLSEPIDENYRAVERGKGAKEDGCWR